MWKFYCKMYYLKFDRYNSSFIKEIIIYYCLTYIIHATFKVDVFISLTKLAQYFINFYNHFSIKKLIKYKRGTITNFYRGGRDIKMIDGKPVN